MRYMSAINDHFRKLIFRYLSCTRPMEGVQEYAEYAPKIWFYTALEWGFLKWIPKTSQNSRFQYVFQWLIFG